MTVQLCDTVTLTETEDGAVLLDRRSGEYWQLNGTGSLIVTSLLRGDTPADVADAVARAYRIDADRATTDVTALITDLTNAHLLTRT
ncbi:lasso peptide biosynthesis PqqD family chaperone [Saccharothrix obliqua]|uniref:lasso peptide biosynthesis PqqD family chaperone n=1 Tax=Saccharothrix obliqua TaxID=2861747 RepID=UPI001C5F4F78|nr:lasso peptide biosynthesis PqqD family chaperone [Saccharothrix obliqua]MBW4718368.1 lasso peptide biosynthesis PqqD family chaperone [Saccharothrix obliqua]